MRTATQTLRIDIYHSLAMLALAAFALVIHAAQAHAIFVPDPSQNVKAALSEALSDSETGKTPDTAAAAKPEPSGTADTHTASTAPAQSDQAARALLGEAMLQAALAQR